MIADAIQNQFDRTWGMLHRTVERLSDEQWCNAPNERMAPARWAYHAVQAVDFYAEDKPEDFRWDELANWEGPVDLLPCRHDLLVYAAQVAAKLRARLDCLSDTEMLNPSVFPWTGGSNLDLMLYVLRHTIYHLGEVASTLRLHGAEETEWA